MTCQEIADVLMDYLNGDLPPKRREVFEEHLGICPDCIAYLRSYEITIQAGKSIRDHGQRRSTQDVPEDLVRAILAACGNQ